MDLLPDPLLLLSTSFSSLPPPSSRIQQKVALFFQALYQTPISLKVLSSLAYQGIPDEVIGLRSLVWRMLVGYLSVDRNKWEGVLKKSRRDYESFVGEFLVKGNKEKRENGELLNKSQTSNSKNLTFAKVQDHPLSKSDSSEWNSLFKDLELWDEVEKDTKRTRSEMSFFREETKPPSSYPLLKNYVPKDPRFSSKLKDKTQNPPTKETHCDVMTRILFLYAKINPGVRYVQGMNEILAPIYYCFAKENNYFRNFLKNNENKKNSPIKNKDANNIVSDNNNKEIISRETDLLRTPIQENEEIIKNSPIKEGGVPYVSANESMSKNNDGNLKIDNLEYKINERQQIDTEEDGNYFKNVECDVFFVFNILMGEIRDGFLRELDECSGGIKSRVKDFQELLSKKDPDLNEHFENNGVNPQFYSLRWLLLLLTQEFEIADVLRLWDALLSHPRKLSYLNYICLGILLEEKEKLMNEDFVGIMGILQNLEGIDVGKILSVANKMYCENYNE